MKLNKKIAIIFLTDSRDFLIRFEILKEKSTHIGLRSKLLTELIFSAECALKAIIFLESEEDEKRTYKKVKNLGHQINQLINALNEETKNKYNKIVKTDLNKYAIYNRYQLESEIDFRETNGDLGKKYYETIANFNWLNNICRELKNLIEYIDSRIPIDLIPKDFSEINLDEELGSHRKLRNIRK